MKKLPEVGSEILTLDECAALLRVKPVFIYSKVRSRSRTPIPCHRIGKYLRFRRSEVIDWFDRMLVTPRALGKKVR